MMISFVILSLVLISSLIYVFIKNYIYGIIFVLSILLTLLLEQILKKMGFELDIFKTRKNDIKVVDELSLIDGRIIDIVNSKFLSGTIVIPKYIVEKLKKLSNSENQIEKFKARRALDIIARLEENDKIPCKIIDIDLVSNDENKKIFEFAKKLEASIITTDMMMIKYGAMENVPILNINDLAFALKQVILPGDEINIFIIKEGKEKQQGVGYLEDGSMVVVEDGYNYIGRKMDVKVQSILQTSNGKIIFTKIKN
jgi:uncharacterized protein YacL